MQEILNKCLLSDTAAATLITWVTTGDQVTLQKQLEILHLLYHLTANTGSLCAQCLYHVIQGWYLGSAFNNLVMTPDFTEGRGPWVSTGMRLQTLNHHI